ncbi:HMG box protein [Coccidioides immitis RS]|uniref:HMG box protein n=3 Tax=Coccidioides immitis TaxID=5501 RepID=J3K9I1_COCIM|nr:HMG box protein [Coccidioides immitis RS]EAS31563.3 HMG box protein [Coccidioides immitis RS]
MNHQHPPSPPPSADGEIKNPFHDLSQNNTLQSPFLRNHHPFTTMYARQDYPFAKIDVDNRDVTEVMTYVRAMQLTGNQHHQHHAVDMGRTGSGGSSSSRGSTGMHKFQDADKSRVQRMTRVRKRTRTARSDKRNLIITAPLSVLTKDMVHIPIRDMKAWVNRSAEVRRKEVAAKNGKIARPMNSFMLYRSAYAERTKEWCAQNNHQVVSRASGQSWPLEPKEIRDLYEGYATIERDNHQKAHPDYKFAPNKTQNTPKKKQTATKDDENSDLDDAGFDIPACSRPVGTWPSRSDADEGFGSRTSTPFDKDSSYESRTSTPFDHPNGDMYVHHSDINRSSWEMVNPGRPLPGVLSPPEQSHYYQPSIHQSVLGPGIEDVTYKKMGVPGVSYEPQGTLNGLPGNPHPELLPTQPSRTVEDSTQVDPQLLEFSHHQQQSVTEAGSYPGHLNLWQVPPTTQHYVPTSIPAQQAEEYLSAHAQQTGFHHGASLMESRDVWGEGHNGEAVKQEFGQEFDQWLTGHHTY